ncbi:VanZ family protein [Lachnoclostridium phocaeense]|uniref:VanZ family protein n=1 Tax=Lachnoclostridium phocaeense TaxID=1871021 RepID=UPI00248EA8D4|nr:VanZ family protein [Lachnoclostridium phocaeense]
MKRNIFTLMVLLWMGIIFWFSAQPADQSERMSLSVGHVAGLLFADGYEDWPQERQEAFEEEIDHGVRKAAHFTEYAILGLLLTAMYRAYGHEGERLFLLAAGTGSLYAATDEFHQLFVQGRSCQITDWMIDTCGVITGAAAVCLFHLIIENRK